MLEVKNLSVKYPEHSNPLVRDISFQLQYGQSLWVTGANGSGKTTLLYSLCNIIPQEIQAIRTGETILNGRRLNEVPLNKLIPAVSIALSNPEWELFYSNPHEELVFALENIGLKQNEIRAKIESVSAAFDLSDKLELQSHKLSAGWKKLVSLAVHAAINPQVLLLDEPFNGLSDTGVSKVVKWLKSYLDNGGILIIAEHNEAVRELNPLYLAAGL